MSEQEKKPAHEVIIDVLGETITSLDQLDPRQENDSTRFGLLGRVDALILVIEGMVIPPNSRESFIHALRALREEITPRQAEVMRGAVSRLGHLLDTLEEGQG